MRFPSFSVRIGLPLLLLLTLFVEAEAKPRKAAFFQSLVVPGWGQFSLDKKNAALAFFGTELVLIGGIYSFRAYGASARDDYEAMAATNAGVVGEHGHDYYVDVGNWMSVDGFNELRLQERNFDELYTREADRWEWDSDLHRVEMRTRRIKSDRAFNSVLYLVGGLVLNHVASAIHAGRASAKHDVSDFVAPIPAWAFSVQPATRHGGVRFFCSHSF